MVRRKKRFFLTFILMIVAWFIWLTILFNVPPDLPGVIGLMPISFVVFFTPLLLAIFLTTAILLGNTRRGFLVTVGVFGFLLLRLFKIGNFLTIGLLGASLFVFELYFSKERD